MTAYRVVTDHEELDNSGQLLHSVIDSYLLSTPWLVVSGSAGPRPPAARVLTAGLGVTITDQGPGKSLLISAGSPPNIVWMDFVTGSRDGVNSVFILNKKPNPTGSLMFFNNGLLQEQGPHSDYLLSGATVSMLYTPRSGSNIWATYPF